jgi:hypothetical protein
MDWRLMPHQFEFAQVLHTLPNYTYLRFPAFTFYRSNKIKFSNS